jgi:hypothetical protein
MKDSLCPFITCSKLEKNVNKTNTIIAMPLNEMFTRDEIFHLQETIYVKFPEVFSYFIYMTQLLYLKMVKYRYLRQANTFFTKPVDTDNVSLIT